MLACPRTAPPLLEAGGQSDWPATHLLMPMLPADEVEAQQQIFAFAITGYDSYTFGILAAFFAFTVSPKSVTLRARILLV
jgi:hypothetical protein